MNKLQTMKREAEELQRELTEKKRKIEKQKVPAGKEVFKTYLKTCKELGTHRRTLDHSGKLRLFRLELHPKGKLSTSCAEVHQMSAAMADEKKLLLPFLVRHTRDELTELIEKECGNEWTVGTELTCFCVTGWEAPDVTFHITPKTDST